MDATSFLRLVPPSCFGRFADFREFFFKTTWQNAQRAHIPLIGIGGIDSAAAALEKIEAGATLLQLLHWPDL